MRTNVSDTSIAAWRNLPVQTLKTQSDRICEIVTSYCNLWGGNLSLREIRNIYSRNYKYIDLSTVAARVNGLVAAKRLERLEETRKCSISRISIHPLRPYYHEH